MLSWMTSLLEHMDSYQLPHFGELWRADSRNTCSAISHGTVLYSAPRNLNIKALAAAAAGASWTAASAAAAAGAVCIMPTKIIYDRVIFATVISKMTESQMAKLLTRRALKTQTLLSRKCLLCANLRTRKLPKNRT